MSRLTRRSRSSRGRLLDLCRRVPSRSCRLWGGLGRVSWFWVSLLLVKSNNGLGDVLGHIIKRANVIPLLNIILQGRIRPALINRRPSHD